MAAASAVALHSEHEAAKQEILPVLLSLLHAADEHDKLLVAASVYRSVQSDTTLPARVVCLWFATHYGMCRQKDTAMHFAVSPFSCNGNAHMLMTLTSANADPAAASVASKRPCQQA